MLSSLNAQALMVDVTGDGVDDDIKIGEQSVVVVDGAFNKKYIVVSGMENLMDVIVDNYLTSTKHKEIGVVFVEGEEDITFTDVYGYKNNKFVKIGEGFCGEISFDEENNLWAFADYWGPIVISEPIPIIEKNELLKVPPLTKTIEKNVEIEARSSKDIMVNLYKNNLVVFCVAVQEKDVIVSLSDETGTVFAEDRIDPEYQFFFYGYAEKDETITLTIDNSYSMMTPKTVYYIISQYKR